MPLIDKVINAMRRCYKTDLDENGKYIVLAKVRAV